MKTIRNLKLFVPVFLTLLIGAVSSVIAHESGQGMSAGGSPASMRGGGYGHHQGMMGHGMGHGQGMMGHGMGYGQGMMGHGMGYGYGMMGPGMGYGYGMGHGHGQGRGMMGRRHGMMGMGPGMGTYRETDLTSAQVKEIMEHRLFHYGNPRLRVGKVQERDDDIIVAEIETVDGSLVDRFEIDRHTGYMWRSQ